MKPLILTNDGIGNLAYGRNASDTIYRGSFGASDIGTTITLDVSQFSSAAKRLFISVTPGMQVLFSQFPITDTETNVFSLQTGDLISYDTLFSIDKTTTMLYFMVVGLPAGTTPEGRIALSFYS